MILVSCFIIILIFVLVDNKPQFGIYLILLSVYFIEWAVHNMGVVTQARWLSSLVISLMLVSFLFRFAFSKKSTANAVVPKCFFPLLIILIILSGASIVDNTTGLHGIVVGLKRPFEMLFLFLVFVSNGRLNNLEFSKKLIKILWVIAIVQIPAAMFEFFFYDLWAGMRSGTSAHIYAHWDAAVGFMPHTGVLGLISIFFCSWVVHKNMVKKSYSNYLLLFLFSVVFFTTYSRASWFYLFVVVLFYVFVHRALFSAKRVMVAFLIVISLYGLLAIGDKYVSDNIMGQGAGYLQSYLLNYEHAYNEQIESRSGRLSGVLLTFDLLKSQDKILVGMGPGSTSTSFLGGYTTKMANYAFMVTGYNIFYTNQICATISEFGFLFFMIYLSVIILFFLKTWDISRNEQDPVLRPFFQALLALDIIMIAGILYNPIWYENQISFIFWIGNAIVLQRSYFYRQRRFI